MLQTVVTVATDNCDYHAAMKHSYTPIFSKMFVHFRQKYLRISLWDGALHLSRRFKS